jgi:hypothetical protein
MRAKLHPESDWFGQAEAELGETRDRFQFASRLRRLHLKERGAEIVSCWTRYEFVLLLTHFGNDLLKRDGSPNASS